MTEDKVKTHSIDAVILWVNGNEDKHIEKISKYVENKSIISSKRFRTRFDQVNEIKFTIDSILKFAPYVENIYILTDEQTPDFLEKSARKDCYSNVSIVDHKVVFKGYEKFPKSFIKRYLKIKVGQEFNLAQINEKTSECKKKFSKMAVA